MRPGSRMYEDDLELQKELEAAARDAEAVALGSQGTNLPNVTRVEVEPEAVTPPSREVIAPKVVQVPGGMEDMDMAYAAAQDRAAKRRMAFERGSRELVAGLTRTQAPDIISQPGDSVGKLLTARKAREEREAKAAALTMQGKKAQAESERARALDARHEREYGDTLEQRGLSNDLRAKDIASRDKNTAVMQGLAVGAGARAQDEADRKAADDAAKKGEGSAVPLLGGTLALRQGLSDTERGEARKRAADWNAADGAIGTFQQNLEAFASNPSQATRDAMIASLRTASSAFNAAIGGGAMSKEEGEAMSQAMGADVLSPSGITAFAQKLLGDDAAGAAQTISARVRAARQANKATALGRLTTYGAYSEGDGRKVAKNKKTGERRYVNPDGSLGEVVK